MGSKLRAASADLLCVAIAESPFTRWSAQATGGIALTPPNRMAEEHRAPVRYGQETRWPLYER